MKWSWWIGRIFGIDIYMHSTFLILLAWIAVSDYLHGHSILAALIGVLFILCLFGIVILHEMGHALMARRFGIRTKDITLLPIGGVARLERMPEDPKQELLVALAGPAVNIVLAGLLFAVLAPLLGTTALTSWSDAAPIGTQFLVQMLWVNVALAVFNLLPAFPMDGGRVLRALLAMRMNYAQATKVAAHIGQGMAVVFGLAGLFFNPFLVIIALFVWVGAGQEATSVQMHSVLSGIPLRQVMVTDFRSLDPQDTLARAVDYTLAGFQQDFPVLQDGQVVGVLTQMDLLAALAQGGLQTPVGTVMERRFEVADPAEMLERALTRLENSRSRTLPVLQGGQLIGVITTENLSEFLMIQYALKESHTRPLAA
ncbi:MAG TPA: site-2 protease family protein [Chthonomonadaceae bacterium]|nr:site-2 protease family protein [Chthonomonadaceae bacterium]